VTANEEEVTTKEQQVRIAARSILRMGRRGKNGARYYEKIKKSEGRHACQITNLKE
jgi:hypothetical protein